MHVCSRVHGAISIVNAIATGRGATLGISLEVRAEIETAPGKGIVIESDNRNTSSRLVDATIRRIVAGRDIARNRIRIRLESDIPTGYGLKSSSAISTAVALCCMKIFKKRYTDRDVMLAGVDASIKSGVSITGAYDDASACYYGGFQVTDNHGRRTVRSARGPPGMTTVIFVPASRRRGRPRRLAEYKSAFEKAWSMAKDGRYWDAMILNGLCAASTLNSDPGTVADLLGAGAVGASVSGNGPAIAAVVPRSRVGRIRRAFAGLDGRIITSDINNKRADVREC